LQATIIGTVVVSAIAVAAALSLFGLMALGKLQQRSIFPCKGKIHPKLYERQ